MKKDTIFRQRLPRSTEVREVHPCAPSTAAQPLPAPF